MAENEDRTQPLPASPAEEPTRVLPPAGEVAEPTIPLSTSAWARPADLGTSASGPSPEGQQPWAPAAGQYPQAAYGQPGQHYAQPGQPYGQHYAQSGQPYGPYGHPGQYAPQGSQYPQPGPYGPGANQWYGQGYGNAGQYPQHPGYYPAQQYYAQPPQKRRTRWPLALVALVVAMVLGGSGFLWVNNAVTGAFPDTGQTTQPQPDQGQGGQSDPTGQNGSGSQGRQGGATTGSSVSAAQSAGVVLIEAQTTSGLAAGTGMVLSADGKVLTNYHVVAGSEKLAVTIADTGDTYVATVLGFDQSRDVALLQLKNASGLTTVKTDTVVPSEGTAVAAVGNAEGGRELVKASGTVTGTDQSLTVSSDSPWGSTEDLSGLIETNARAVPGDSGGPMFDAQNEVVGMTTAGSTRDRTSYAVPIGTALAVVQQVESGQDAGTVRVGPAGYLGIKVADAGTSGSGKTITDVVAGSPADKAGVTAGSRLTVVDGTPIKASTNLATVIRALEPGQQVVIEWTAPNGTHKQATVTLGSSPVN